MSSKEKQHHDNVVESNNNVRSRTKQSDESINTTKREWNWEGSLAFKSINGQARWHSGNHSKIKKDKLNISLFLLKNFFKQFIHIFLLPFSES